jgi:hypothetical protein
LCQTDPQSGQCSSAVGPGVTFTINTNATPIFAIFATARGAVPFVPQTNRILVQFSDGKRYRPRRDQRRRPDPMTPNTIRLFFSANRHAVRNTRPRYLVQVLFR